MQLHLGTKQQKFRNYYYRHYCLWSDWLLITNSPLVLKHKKEYFRNKEKMVVSKLSPTDLISREYYETRHFLPWHLSGCVRHPITLVLKEISWKSLYHCKMHLQQGQSMHQNYSFFSIIKLKKNVNRKTNLQCLNCGISLLNLHFLFLFQL